MNDDDEAELVWAKMNGDWSNANYRREVARNGTCLDILIDDVNIAVSTEASKQIIDNILRQMADGTNRDV